MGNTGKDSVMELEFRLTDEQQAILLLIKCGKDNELNPKWKNLVDSLFKLNLIQYKPNTLDELMLTVKGEDCIVKSIIVKYPLESKGDIGSYNKTVQSMEPTAINALVCAMINEKTFSKIPKKTARVLGQHFLDISFFKEWGSILIDKWFVELTKSRLHFKKMEERHSSKNE